ncbi:MAG TPA: C45 family peptidase [Acidobacteriaceae bacterium]|jgi:hypothetical protein|nr:C45 family peptidase [Acidobacteriaceae bacterium]
MRPLFRRYTIYLPVLAACLLWLPLAHADQKPAPLMKQKTARVDALLAHSYRFERDHWIYVHLQGTPSQIGFQHGWLLAPEIVDAFHTIQVEETHSTHRDWKFFRATAQNVFWPHIDTEYRQEFQGIADGLRARGVKDMDVWDVVAVNGMNEIPNYYVPWLNTHQHAANAPNLKPSGNCSAFVATGDWTRDHKPVIAHSDWASFMEGARWRIMYDIVPQHGYRILMDGFPGTIDSGDDFGINGAGLAVTETTITAFSLYDPNGIPEFVRAREAMQYASSIDDYVRIMVKGNNGGYANDWLLADSKTGEIARFELGLKIHRVWRTKNGYFAGANFPSDPELIKKETSFDPNNPASSPNARHKRWDQLMAQHKGQIDTALAQQFLADHFDAYTGKEARNERTLCGHVDVSAHGVPEWGWPPYDPGGAVNAKAADSTMIQNMSMMARTGRPCGEDFLVKPFLAKHPEFDWQKPVLTDMKGNPWASFHKDDTSGS